MRRFVPVLAVLLAACGSPAPAPSYTVLDRHGPLVFMLMSPAMPMQAESWRRAVRQACGDADICNVKIWTDPSRAAQGFPMTDLEASAIEAAYLVNRATGADGFICHPFGEITQRCAK